MPKKVPENVITKSLHNAWSERRFNYGMTQEEIHKLLKEIGLHYRTFWKYFGIGHTCGVDKSGEVLYYYCDIEEVLAYVYKYRRVYWFQGD